MPSDTTVLCPWCGAIAETVRPGHAPACINCAVRLDMMIEEAAPLIGAMTVWMAAVQSSPERVSAVCAWCAKRAPAPEGERLPICAACQDQMAATAGADPAAVASLWAAIKSGVDIAVIENARAELAARGGRLDA